MRTLIVDDSSAMRMIVKRTLKQAGYDSMEFEEADDGDVAFAMMSEFEPHLVMCDWNMPNMSGLELLTALRGAGNGVKFGFVTTESTAAMRTAAREAGAQFLIAKPFTVDSMASALRPVIGEAAGGGSAGS